MPLHVRTYHKGFGPGRKEESYVGTPDECCAVCHNWTLRTQDTKQGEGKCSKMPNDGTLVWGGALCADFNRDKRRVPAEAK